MPSGSGATRRELGGRESMRMRQKRRTRETVPLEGPDERVSVAKQPVRRLPVGYLGSCRPVGAGHVSGRVDEGRRRGRRGAGRHRRRPTTRPRSGRSRSRRIPRARRRRGRAPWPRGRSPGRGTSPRPRRRCCRPRRAPRARRRGRSRGGGLVGGRAPGRDRRRGSAPGGRRARRAGAPWRRMRSRRQPDRAARPVAPVSGPPARRRAQPSVVLVGLHDRDRRACRPSRRGRRPRSCWWRRR